MDRETDRRRLAWLAALPMWAAAEFTESEAAVMRIVGVEMLNNRGVCALHLKVIAAAAGVSVGTARDALKTAEAIGFVTVERLMGNYGRKTANVKVHPRVTEICGRRRRRCRRSDDSDNRMDGPGQQATEGW
jgi:hypothetical protein